MVKAPSNLNCYVVHASGCLNDPRSKKLTILPPLFDTTISVHIKGDPHVTSHARENHHAGKKEDDCALVYGHLIVIMVDCFKEWLTNERVDLLISVNTIYICL